MDSELVRAVRPFKTRAGIWIMPGSVAAIESAEAHAAYASGDGVSARTGVDEAAVVRMRETAMVRSAARGNGKCRTSSTQAQQKSRSLSRI